MKLLSIIINDLKEFINSEKRVFIILVCGLIVAFISFLMLFSFSLSSREDHQKEFGYKTRTYHINLSNYANLEEKNRIINKLQEIEGNTKVEEICLTSKIRLTDTEQITVVGYFAKRDLFLCTEGRKFNDNEHKNASSVIIPWVGFFDYSKKTSYLDNLFKLNKINYKITGIADNCPPNTVFIPYNTYITNKYDISSISITYSKRLDSEQELELNKIIETDNPLINIIYPPKVDTSQEKEFLQRLLIYLCLLIFTLVNVVSMFRFWIYKNANKFMIFRLCGAGNTRVYMIIMLEALILSTVLFLSSYTIYYCVTPILKELKMNYFLNIYHLIIAYIIIITVISLLVNKTALRIIKSTDIHTLRWEEA